MIRAGVTNRLKQLALGGALAALVAIGAGGAQAATAHQALNFAKIEFNCKASPKLMMYASPAEAAPVQLVSWSWGETMSGTGV